LILLLIFFEKKILIGIIDPKTLKSENAKSLQVKRCPA